MRKALFDLLCLHSSPVFIEYLRAYENLTQPPREGFEVSCELINGVRVDNMRVAIMCLRMKVLLRWLSACRRKIPMIQDLLFKNTTDGCFGIGLADYPSGSGICRTKIYNEYGNSKSQVGKIAHVQQLFPLLNIPDVDFRKDSLKFSKMNISCIDWDREKRAAIKVYFGPFPLEHLFGRFSEVFSKEEILCYDILRKKGLLPEMFQFSIKYSQDGRSIKTELRYQTMNIVPYLKKFDPKQEVSNFLVDFYRLFPDLSLQVISMQWIPVEKIQFYFLMVNEEATTFID